MWMDVGSWWAWAALRTERLDERLILLLMASQCTFRPSIGRDHILDSLVEPALIVVAGVIAVHEVGHLVKFERD